MEKYGGDACGHDCLFFRVEPLADAAGSVIRYFRGNTAYVRSFDEKIM